MPQIKRNFETSARFAPYHIHGDQFGIRKHI